MKLDLETWGEEKARLMKWHKWFAWYPVYIKSHDFRWLEFVMRRGTEYHGYSELWDWIYKPLAGR